jgi:CRISPR-associated protein Csh1
MLSAVKALGDYSCKSEELSLESMFAENSKLEGVKKVFCIDFEYNNEKAIYKGIFAEDFDRKIERSTRYLYRIFRHQRYDVTPTSRMADPEKLRQRFGLWFRQCSDEYLKDPLLSALKEEFLGKIDRIFDDLKQEYLSLAKEDRKNAIATITINGEKHIGDFEIFRRILRNEACHGFYSKHGVESKGNGICFLCRKKTEVMGFASPFSVYTFDKKGFAPNFLREEAWKRLPICMECATILSAGRDFLNKHFYKGFYGLNFYVIPNFVLKVDNEVLEDFLIGKKKSYRKLVCNEDYISEAIAEKGDQVSLTFVFTKPKQSDYFDIMRSVEYVPTSWIREILKVEKEIGLSSIFQEEALKLILGDKTVGNFDENEDTSLGGLIRPFFPQSKYEGVHDKYFVDLVSDVLAQKGIGSRLLLAAFTRAMRSSFIKCNDRHMKVLALKSLMLVLLTSKLELLPDWGEEEMNSTADNEDRKITQFFAEYKNAFNTSSKRAVFLEGIMTKYLMDIQFANRRSTPFRDKLYGLKLDERRVKKLLPEIIEKLREYKMAYSMLEKLTAEAFLDSENKGWNLTTDETSYFFALGMTLAPIFKTKVEKVNED